MTGSVADGEDVVQDTLARACYELPQLRELPSLRPWLFRIAHHRAVDHWRHERHRASEPLDAALDIAEAAALEPDNTMARRQAVGAALAAFLALAPAQRGCVILKDVLDHSLDEIADELDLTLPAVKAALHRGRAALQRAAAAAPRRHAVAGDLAGAQALREPLQRARLGRRSRAPRRRRAARSRLAPQVGGTARRRQLSRQLRPHRRLAPDARALRRPRGARGARLGRRHRPAALCHRADVENGRITRIRDFRYVPYIAQEGFFELETDPVAGTPPPSNPEVP